MLSRNLDRYVEQKRALGYKFHTQSVQLRLFVTFAEKHGDRHVRCSRVVAWASLAPSLRHRRNRVLLVRRFALALRADDPRHECPNADVFGKDHAPRRRPYIYSEAEIRRLLRAATAVRPGERFTSATLKTLFGLIAATGMRVSEALALRLEDLTPDGLLIRETKFFKSRLLPLHDTVREALNRYLVARRKVPARERSMFVSTGGTALPYWRAHTDFRRMIDFAGLRGANDGRDPRIHDLRHTFAVRSLESCCRDRPGIGSHMVALSTYLGHTCVTHTYWYLHSTPLLLKQIAEAGEALHTGAGS